MLTTLLLVLVAAEPAKPIKLAENDPAVVALKKEAPGLHDEEIYRFGGAIIALTDPPALLIQRAEQPLERIPLPGMIEGWSIVQVDATSFFDADGDGHQDIAFILTLSPISQRSQDYWPQPFIFSVRANGKIEADAKLNERIAAVKPRIATIAKLRSFLRSKRPTLNFRDTLRERSPRSVWAAGGSEGLVPNAPVRCKARS